MVCSKFENCTQNDNDIRNNLNLLDFIIHRCCMHNCTRNEKKIVIIIRKENQPSYCNVCVDFPRNWYNSILNPKISKRMIISEKCLKSYASLYIEIQPNYLLLVLCFGFLFLSMYSFGLSVYCIVIVW